MTSTQAEIDESYSVSNDFFKLWLDENMHYTSAAYDDEDISLEEAQERKARVLYDFAELAFRVFELMRGVESSRRLRDHVSADHRVDADPSARGAAQHSDDRLTLEVLHHQEEVVLFPSELVDVHHVRMPHTRGDARLVEEHLHEHRVPGEVGQDALDHDRRFEAARPAELPEKDLGHSARFQAAEHVVATDALW